MSVLAAVGLCVSLLAAPAAGRAKARPGTPVPRAVPIENAAALRPFFAALAALDRPAALPTGTPDSRLSTPDPREPGDGADAGIVRVLHLGDSHVAADWWSDELRQALQRRFGDAGVGLVMPGRPWAYFHHERARSPRAGWRTLGLGDAPGDGLLGLSGVALAPRPGASAASVIASFSRFEVQLGLPEGEACVQVSVDGAPLFSGRVGAGSGATPDLPPGLPLAVAVTPVEATAGSAPPVIGSCRALAFLGGEVAPGEHVLSVEDACGGAPLVLGVDVRHGTPGVVVDTLGLNGGELVWLERADPAVRRALLARVRPHLIIVSYGANDMTAAGFSRDGYEARARRILASLRRDAPGAAALVTAPFDRSHRRKGARRELVRRNEPEIAAALRAAALAEGCAFWDARAAMGGEGAIEAWRSRGLASRDLVHLTERGYRLLGSLLAESLLAAADISRGEADR